MNPKPSQNQSATSRQHVIVLNSFSSFLDAVRQHLDCLKIAMIHEQQNGLLLYLYLRCSIECLILNYQTLRLVKTMVIICDVCRPMMFSRFAEKEDTPPNKGGLVPPKRQRLKSAHLRALLGLLITGLGEPLALALGH